MLQENPACPLPDQQRAGPGGGAAAGLAGRDGDGVRAGGGRARHLAAAAHGGADDRGVAQLLPEDRAVQHCARCRPAPVP